jgi:alkylation response protein AidB-like acyl-CoA dehydrogenase
MSLTPTNGEALLDAARELVPAIVCARDDIERERRLPSSLADAMRSAQLFELWLPKIFGGPELHPIDFLRVVEELSRGDGSAGWCAAVHGVYSLLAGGLSETAAREISAGHAVIAGTINPTGRASVIDGGYRVSGRWSYGSGIAHSVWTIGNCVVQDEAGPRRSPSGAPELRFMFFPTSAVEIIDTWRVGGMRGTGSHDFRVEDLFVPEGHSMPAFVAQDTQPGTLYRMPMMSLFVFALGAVTLGIARAAIASFVELAGAKTPMGSTALLRDKSSAQADIGRAETMVRAARAFLVEAVEQQWAEIAAGQAPSLAKRAAIRLASTFAGEASVRAVDLVYAAGGGSAIYESGRIDRCFRDVHVAVQHIGLTTNNYELTGRVLLGLDPGTPRF